MKDALGNAVQAVKGWYYPDEVEIPEESWYRMDFGGRVVHDLDKEGHLYVARQRGLQTVKTDIVSSGESEGILYAAARAVVVLDGETYTGIGGADETSDQVRDPEHVFSVAETRAIKRAVKHGVGIRSADGPSPSDQETQTPPDAPDGVDDPPSQWDDDPEPAGETAGSDVGEFDEDDW
jgi:hypothetical protein